MHLTFHKEIDNLRSKFLILGSMVEDRVRKACSAINTRDPEIVHYILTSDYEVDDMEIEIEEDCLKILALHQPVARDLRFIISIIKINNEMERIADYAQKIARRIEGIKQDIVPLCGVDFDIMSEKVITMLRLSLDSLINRDVDLAHKIFILDDDVDAFFIEAIGNIKQELKKTQSHPECLLNAFLIARHLERIADRATNIAEEVIYMVEGEIVRGDHNN
ncbi:MAG: phosphate signaling complex protein PhoU [Desulfobulbaceae bacterium]|uniref:Phosphate-specific transport system accessory protein PhoU n=1 Tax=Candidatus Desulfobia pelagia TaxID=2841692 RepID=A0A8J6NAH3_9BACT|nr:phosphate signaling complex protein PhoU [Candidatus Desulfobia pelagia]